MKLKILIASILMAALAVIGYTQASSLAREGSDNRGSQGQEDIEDDEDLDDDESDNDVDENGDGEDDEDSDDDSGEIKNREREGDDSGVGTQTRQRIEEGDDSDDENEDDSNKAEQRRSAVANAVQEMLQIADRVGGIGEQVRVIAQAQNENQEKIEEGLKKVKERSSFAKFFIGPNFGEIENVEEILDQNREQIEKLNQIKDQLTNQADQQTIAEQVQLLEQASAEIEGSLEMSQKGFSLLGWLFRALAK